MGHGLVDKGFWVGFQGMTGMIQIKSLKEAQTDNQKNLDLLEAYGVPCPYLTRSTNPQALQRGIQAVGDTWAGHSGMFVSKSGGKLVRKNHPDLLSPRILPEDGWQGKILKPVPVAVNDYETIESQILINTNTMVNAVRNGEQVVAFIRDWTPEEADAIMYAAYYMYSAPYDIFEIGTHAFPFIPNPSFLKVCSTFIECALEGEKPTVINGPDKGDKEIHDWFTSRNADVEALSPGDLGKYFFANPKYKALAFNCDLSEAKEKI